MIRAPLDSLCYRSTSIEPKWFSEKTEYRVITYTRQLRNAILHVGGYFAI